MRAAGGACAGTRTRGGQDRRLEGRQGLRLASRTVSIPTEREKACCRSGSPAGSDRERERAETRDSSLGQAKRSRGLGGGQGFVDFDSCNVRRARWFAPRQPEANDLHQQHRPWMLSSALHSERRAQCLVQGLIGRLAEKISVTGRRDPRSRKVRASLLPITAAQASLHLPQTATSVVRQLSTTRTEKGA